MNIKKASFTECYDAMYQDMLAHWDEVPFGNFNLELDLDTEKYLESEAAGYARYYLVRNDSGKAIAYMSVFASPMFQHKGVMCAVTDAFYVAPDYRDSGVFADLLKFVEKDLTSCGIDYFSVVHNPMYKGRTDLFLESIGYCKTEISFTKELTWQR